MLKKQLILLIAALLIAAGNATAATFIVTTTGDTGGAIATEEEPGIFTVDTLRSAVELADDETAFPGPDQIVFAESPFEEGPTTIQLGLVGDSFQASSAASSDSALGIDSDITITGPRTATLTLTTSGLRHFQLNNGRLSLSHLTLRDGFAPDNLSGIGGVIIVLNTAHLSLNDLVVADSQANRGGAIGIHSSATNPVAVINQTVFINNAASQSTGGAIQLDTGSVLITQSIFRDNSAISGGAVFASTDDLVVDASVFDGNTASSGGAIVINNNGAMTLLNSTVTNNTARSAGGGIDLRTRDGNAQRINRIVNTTITGNRSSTRLNEADFVFAASGDSLPLASSGGGLFASASTDIVLLHNTLITANHEFTGPGELAPTDIAAVPLADSSNNLFSTADPLIGLSDGVNGNQIGTLASPIDALLLPLADNGGPTLTHQLDAGSPAVDAGSDARADDQNLITDQRGFERFVGTVDIGAVEFGATDIGLLFVDGFESN